MITKVFLILTFFLSFENPSEARSDVRNESSKYYRTYYETGQTKAEGWLFNDSKTGYWKFYHSNGTISAQGYYENGKRVKYWYFYSPKRIRTKEGHYQDGKKTDWWLFYDQNGRVNHKCQLRSGIRDGYCLQYMDEKLTSAEKYQNGKRLKKWTSFSSFKRENKLSDLQ